MLVMQTLVLGAADAGTRPVLLILLLLAVVLIIAGAVIALFTFFNLHKAAVLQPEMSQLETQNI